MVEDIYGRGLKFPIQIDPATGRFMESEKEQNIKESIYLILMTQKTERFLRPDFGSNIMNYTFSEQNQTILNMMSHEISNDITRSEPRIKNVNVNIDSTSKEGCLLIYIDYTIIETSTKDNMVFPFYLDIE